MNQKQHENLDMSRIVSPSSGPVGSKKSTLSPSAQQPPPQYQHTFLLNEYQPANKTPSQTTTTPTKAASLKGRQKQLKQPPPPQRLDSESISSTLSVEMNKPAVRPSLAAAADTTGAVTSTTTSPALCFSPRVDVEQKNPWIQSSPSIRKSSLDKADSSRRNSVSFTSDNRLLAPSSTSSSSSKDPKLTAADQSDDTATTSAGGGLSFPQFVKNLQNFTPALPKKPSYTNIHHTKPNRRAQVYNFLERPTGWKCFIYHFTVYYNRLI